MAAVMRFRGMAAALAGAAAIAAVALALANPARSVAAECDRDFQGGGGASWDVDGSDSGWDDAFLTQSIGEPVLEDAFAGYTRIFIDGVEYDNNDGSSCKVSNGGIDLVFPSVEVASGIAVRPYDHVDAKRPAARELLKLTNTTGAKVTFDFDWEGSLGNEFGSIRVDRTSSGDGKATKVDGWATTCQDVGKKGCLKQTPIRGPELAHVWEGLDGKHDGLDAIELVNDQTTYDFGFNNITLGAGKSTYVMRWVALAAGAKRARKVAHALANEPAWAFAGIPPKQRKLIRNW